MFAVVKTGGKQYKVRVGETIDVEKLEVEEGAQVRLDQVLLAANDGDVAYGRPVIAGAAVTARVVRQHKGPKLIVFRYKSKSRYRRRTGHRQRLTQLAIQTIEIPGWETARIETSRAATPATERAAPASEAPAVAPVPAAPTAEAAVAAPLPAVPATETPVAAPDVAAPATEATVQAPAPTAPVAEGSAAPAGDVLPLVNADAQVEPPAANPLASRPGMAVEEPTSGLPDAGAPDTPPTGAGPGSA